MDFYAISHFSNRALRVDLKASDAGESKSVAVMLSRIAEFDARGLFIEDGYPSMRAYCMGELKYPEEMASKRIYAARTARKLPVLFLALADGRLNLSGLVMLARHLRSGNVVELLASASHKTNEEIAQLIAERFPRPDLPERLETIAAPPMPAPGEVDSVRNADALFATAQPCPGPAPEDSVRNVAATPPAPESPLHPSGNAASLAPRGRMTPLAPERVAFQFTGDQETRELYEQFRALVSHEIPSGEMALVLKAALKIAVAERAKRKFAATDRPGHSRGSADPRHITATVKRAVCERDQKRCTFVSAAGKRCDERRFLEYDHIEPVARGGKSTVENVRLRCRAHNQFEAERAFGAEFMERKRDEAKHAAGP
jgi:hypothetical protein